MTGIRCGVLVLAAIALTGQQKPVYPGADEKSPSRAHYFTWINNTNEGATEAQTLINLEFFRWLRDEYGMVLDIYAFDAGNVDTPRVPGSLTSERFQRQFPHGLAPIQKAAETSGARLGVWLGPDGFGKTPEEEKARTETLVSLCRDYHFELFKIDAVGGQLRPEKQDAFIDMMTACRQYSPDLILLNHRLQLGKALPHATTFLWQGSESYIDVNMSNRITAPHHRAGALSRGLVPEMKRLTEDHGVCLSSALDFWEDELFNQAFGRSLLLAPEIYGNPWLLRDDEFPKLARIYNLHRRYGKLLTNGMQLPEDRYGPHAVSRGDGATRFLALKNLTWNTVKYKLALDSSIGLTTTGMVELRRLHPSEQVLGRFPVGSQAEVEVLPFRSSLLVAAVQPLAEIAVEGVNYEVVRDTPGKPVLIKLLGMAGTSAEMKLLPPGRRFASATLDGAPLRGFTTGAAVRIRFPGKPLSLPWHRKLGDAVSVPVPADAEALYEASAFAADSNALEVRSLARSGPTDIPEVEKARQAFFQQPLFTERGIWDKFLFDGNLETAFNARRPGGVLRIDLSTPTMLDSLVLRLAKPNPKAIEEARAIGNQIPAVAAGPIAVDWPAVKADASPDLRAWHPLTVRDDAGSVALAPSPGSGRVRYVRIMGAPSQLAEAEGHRGAGKISRTGWRASNLIPPYRPAVKAWQLKTRIEEAGKGSYLAIALPGQYGSEGAYAAVRIGGKWIGAPDRAVSYPANPWEVGSAVSDRNYTYYVPVTPEIVGKDIEIVVLAFREVEMTPEVWITAYPIPYQVKHLVLAE